MAEIRKQTGGKVPEEQLNSLLMQGLGKAQEHVITNLVGKGVDLDLSSQAVVPDQAGIPACSV